MTSNELNKIFDENLSTFDHRVSIIGIKKKRFRLKINCKDISKLDSISLTGTAIILRMIMSKQSAL